jgi:hypothetical protein
MRTSCRDRSGTLRVPTQRPVGGLDDADATRATELEPDEIDERLIEVARKEQERWTLWALLAQLQELRSDVAEAARIASDVQGH